MSTIAVTGARIGSICVTIRACCGRCRRPGPMRCPEDAFVVMAAGRSPFRVDDLLRLADLVGRLRRAAAPPPRV